ncbi:MAG: HD family phosphohydrolase [Spirochaetota bacterium]
MKMSKKKRKRSAFTRHKSHIRVAMLLLVCIVLLASAADILLHRTLLTTIDQDVRGIQAGDIAQQDVTADEDVQYIDRQETEELQEAALSQVHPVFRVSLTASLQSLETIEQIENILLDDDATEAEKIEQLEQQNLDRYFVGNDLQTVLSYGKEDLQYLFLFTEELLIEVFEIGIINKQELQIAGEPEVIELKRIHNTESSLETISSDQLLTRSDVFGYAKDALSSNNELIVPFKETVARMVNSLAVENVRYDSITTERNRKAALQDVDPVVKDIEQGELVIKRGFRVTEEDIEKLRAIEETAILQTPQQIAGRVIYYLLITIAAAAAIRPLIPKSSRFSQYLYIILTSLILYIVLYTLLILRLYEFETLHIVFFSPILIFSMLITAVINRKTALLVSGYLVLISLFVPEITVIEMTYMLAVGVFGSFILEKARRRIDLVRSVALAAVFSAVLSLIVSMVLRFPSDQVYYAMLHAFLMGISSGIVVVFVLPVMEHLLNLPTDFRLVELTTMSSKVLKRMAALARGTYSHSVAVADLAETASEHIGANYLLARVGAYYHDIGKIDQPEYFIENQTGDNKHDDLKPSLSAVVIKSHVKLGIEKAKEIGLPQEVIDILAQHHGSDVISYFYREALLKSDNRSKISPEDFSYNGTPPMSREAAVVMLADSVDAASRTLKQPTAAKIEKFVWKIIMEKIERKQLVNCDLSLKDIEMIKESFVMKLSGRFHTRIEYPETHADGKRS